MLLHADEGGMMSHAVTLPRPCSGMPRQRWGNELNSIVEAVIRDIGIACEVLMTNVKNEHMAVTGC